MKTTTKVLALVLCAALLVIGTAFATTAFLTTEDTVTNTFTVGNVAIVLDETDVDGSKTNVTTEGRDKANEYHLIPGSYYVKDPKVTVSAGSEDCWIFVKVENGLKDIITGTAIEAQMTANGWALVDGTTDIYAYNTIATASNVYPVFDSFTVADNADVSAYSNATIVITAYAVQAEGFDTAAAAWAAGFGA